MGSINYLYIIILSLSVCFTEVLQAGNFEGYSQTDTLKLDEVIIRKQRKISDAGMIMSQIDSLVMDGKAIRSLSEVLAENSVIFIKTYGRGALATASFRGTAPSHTRVTWNGMEINSPMLGMTDFSLIPVYFTDEINLFHGAGSVREIPGALGGIISLNTKPGSAKNFSASYIQGIGSYGSWDNFLKFNLNKNKFQSGTRVFLSSSENNFKYLNRDIIDSVDIETGKKYYPVDVNRYASYMQYGFLQEFFYRPVENRMLRFSIWGQKADRQIPSLTSYESGDEGGRGRQFDNILRINGSWKHYGEKLKLEYLNGLSFEMLDYEFVTDISGFGLLKLVNSEAETFSLLQKVLVEYNLNKKGVIHTSASWLYGKVNSHESVLRSGFNKQRNQASILMTWSQQWGNRIFSAMTIGEELSEDKWSPLLFNISGEYHFKNINNLYLSAGFSQNVKFPVLNDLYYQPGGNPFLKHETALSHDMALNWKCDLTNLRLDMNFGYYLTKINDWILWLPTFKGYWEPGNIDKVNASGLESSVNISGNKGEIEYKVRIDYAFTSSRNMSKPVHDSDLSSGMQLPFIPLHSANALINLSGKGFSLTWLWNYFSERFINTSNNYHSSRDYLYPFYMNQLTAGKSFTIGKYNFNISLGIHNLFNEEYRSILQRPMPGRNFTFMLKINI